MEVNAHLNIGVFLLGRDLFNPFFNFLFHFSDCGCGAGDSGCSNCGCCKVCAGESDRWGGGIGFHELEEVEPEIYEKVRRIRKREKKEKKEKKEKEAGGGMGLQLLFGG